MYVYTFQEHCMHSQFTYAVVCPTKLHDTVMHCFFCYCFLQSEFIQYCASLPCSDNISEYVYYVSKQKSIKQKNLNLNIILKSDILLNFLLGFSKL